MIQRRKPILRKTRLSPISKKRQKDMKTYSALTKELLRAKPICEICLTRKSTDCHHKHGRSGANYLDAQHFMALCRQCHREVHERPSWARERGYLK